MKNIIGLGSKRRKKMRILKEDDILNMAGDKNIIGREIKTLKTFHKCVTAKKNRGKGPCFKFI